MLRNRSHLLLSAVVAAFLSIAGGCASIQTYETMEQPADSQLRTHLNGQVFKVVRSSDLPNAARRADLFGGKVDRGFVELRYLGRAEDGRLRLRLMDVETTSNETTLSGYGPGQATASATTTMTQGGSWTTATGVYIPPRQGRTEILPPNTLEFLYDQHAGPLAIGRVEVTFLDATDVSLTYKLRRLRSE